MGTINTVDTSENNPYAFTASDFGFSDPNNFTAENFEALEVTTLPANGVLTAAGTRVTAGEYVSAADISDGAFLYTPPAFAYASPEDSFTFQVQDNGGTLDGGVNTDPIPETMTIDVAPSSTTTLPTITTVSANIDPSIVGDTMTFTAAVVPTTASGTPTGTVQFEGDGIDCGSPVALNGSGEASISSSALSVGTHTIAALYRGDSIFAASTDTSSPLDEIVNTNLSLINPGFQTGQAGTMAAIAFSSSDSDGGQLTFSTSSTLPAGASFNTSTGEISGCLADNAAGRYWITVTATDSDSTASASVSFLWYVSPPTVTVSNPGNQTKVIGDALDVTLTSSDSDGYPLTFSVSGLPAGLGINTSTGAITGTVLPGSVGTYTVAITATDSSSGVTDIVVFTWTINPATPTITWSNPSNITLGTALSGTQLDATANVPGIFSYTLANGSSASGALLPLGNGQVLNVTFTPTDTANYTTATAQVRLTSTRRRRSSASAPPLPTQLTRPGRLSMSR